MNSGLPVSKVLVARRGNSRAVERALESIPSHWAVQRFKGVTRPREERNTDAREMMLSLTIAGRLIDRSETGGRQEPADESVPRYLIARPGDLVINPMWLTGGSIGVSDKRGAVSPDYRVFEFRDVVDPQFLHAVLRSSPYFDQYRLYIRANTTFDRRIRQDDLDNLPIPVPPLDEQRRIADFLKRQTDQIDALIAKQEQLIETLRERREAVIRAVLVCGLIPAKPRKPSGVEWLGEVPAHWRVVPTRYLCTITTGGEDSGNATDNGEYPFYVRGREVLRIGKYSFDCEAVMTPGDGQGGVGKVFHYANGRFEAHQRVYVFKDFKGIEARYFYYFLSTFLRPVALAGNNKVTMESLRRPLLAEFKVPVPPKDEQLAILAYLDEQAVGVDALITNAEEFIALARERRAALITEAVTGRIDVSTGKAREGA